MKKGFLAEKEVHKVRMLWEMVFAEDSKTFTDYYFENKAERNLVFTRMDTEEIVSMLHLTPYVTGRMEPVCYIVGIATKEKYRRQGLMADLLKEALQFLWEEGQTFTFLMPANPAYYMPFQFTYIYDKPIWELNENVFPVRYLERATEFVGEFHLVIKEKGSLRIKVAGDEDMTRLAEFANDLLRRNTDCYMLRSSCYYKLLKKELIAQNGNLFLIEREGRLHGILAYVCENQTPRLQEVIMSEELSNWQLVNAEDAKPTIMARLLRVEEFFTQLHCAAPVDFLMDVIDPILTQNSGIYHVYGETNGVLTCKKRPKCSLADCQVMIDDLTAFTFAYKDAEECFRIYNEDIREEILDCLKQIRVWKRTFITEIV